MCKTSKRLTPFAPKVRSQREKETLQRSVYAMYNITNHDQNRRGLARWTPAHKQAWELERIENSDPVVYNLSPVV